MSEPVNKPLPFGDPSRYYSGKEESDREQANLFDFAKVDREVQAALKDHYQSLFERVERTVKTWNQPLRDWIRETRLGGAGRQPVAVNVVDGLPRPFSEAFHDISNPLLWELILNNAILKSTVNGLTVLSENIEALSNEGLVPYLEEGGSHLNRNHVEAVKAFAENAVKWINKQAINERLKRINEDVLGAYFFRARKIRIYWMAIGLISRMLDVSLEGLTIKVLAHELVHAYSHVGIDADDEHWDTEALARTDLRIVEGLAQFYTAIICRRLDDRVPGTWQAFERLLANQSEPYAVFQSWTKPSERAGEIIRSAMVHTRKRKIMGYEDFLDEIARVRESMGRRLN